MDSPTSQTTDLEKGTLGSSQSSTASNGPSAPIPPHENLSASTKWWIWRPWTKSKTQVREVEIRKLDANERSYRSLAVFLDSDENFMLYRRFGYLHSRLLLRKQDQLRKLEAELDDYDNDDAGTEDRKRLLMSRDSDEAADRKEPEGTRTRTLIMDEIEVVLEKYDEWILRAQRMVSLNKPAARDYQSVEGYLFDKKLLVDEEYGFIYNKEDLITLRDGREMAFLDSVTEKMLQTFHCTLLQRIFCTKTDREKTDDPFLHYYSKSRKNTFITTILCLVLLCLLVLPVFILYKLTEASRLDVTSTGCIGVLLAFTLLFSAVLSLFTQAKRHEVFAAAAGYCAILVVFISNVSGPN